MLQRPSSRVVATVALALGGFGLNAVVACSDDGASSTGEGGSGAGSSNPDTSSTGVGDACEGTAFAPVDAACSSLCDTLEGRGCTWAESWIPTATFQPKLFSLYVSGPAGSAFDVAKCNSSCSAVPTSGGAEACNVERTAYIDCLASKGSCEAAGDGIVYL